MTDKTNEKTVKSESKSAIWRGILRITAYIYAFLASCSVFNIKNDPYKNSKTSHLLGRRTARSHVAFLDERMLEKSRTLQAIDKARLALASISLNVYGIFFTVYALTSAFMYYISIAINGENDNGISAILLPMVIFICAIPMLLTSRSVSEVVVDSKIMRSIVLNFFSIPEEKLRSKKAIGGTEYMFLTAILALLLGIFTYFLHPAYVPVVLGLIILVSLVTSNPETGVLITVAIAPFLQYTKYAKEALGALVLLTMLAYIGKVAKRRRAFIASAGAVLTLIFCAFILVAGVFSYGGRETLGESVLTVIIIAGGFFLPFNLIQGRHRLDACTKILSVSFISICSFGIWNIFYNAVVEKNFYTMHESVSPIFENNTIYIADNVTVFSALVVMLFPLMLSNLVKKRSVDGVVPALLCIVITAISAFVYGSYEAVVAILIETIIFFLLYGNKSLAVMLIAIIPVSLFVIAYPIIAGSFGLESISETIQKILPLNDPQSAIRADVLLGSVEMIKSGNLAGIGVGEKAFVTAFSEYSNAVSIGATDPGSFWLQLVCWSGIGGATCFAILAVTVIIKAMGASVIYRDKSMRADMLALLCATVTVLLLGGVNCIWSDVRMLYIFWVLLGILSAHIRESEKLSVVRDQSFCDDVSAKDVELFFRKSN